MIEEIHRHILRQVLRQPIIPVVEIESTAHAEPLADAIYKGGINIVEVVLRTAKAVEAIRIIRRQLPEMLVGAGTVLTNTQANQVIDAGAQFGVAPGLNPLMIKRFHTDGLPFIPGVITPTEIETALHHDCSLLKFFPAEAAGGLTFLKAIAGPYLSTDIQFCATGGITLDNMNDYLSLPIVSAVGGSWLATREQIHNQQWKLITEQAAAAVNRLGAADGSQ